MSAEPQDISPELHQAKLIMERVLGPHAHVTVESGFAGISSPMINEAGLNEMWESQSLDGAFATPGRDNFSSMTFFCNLPFHTPETSSFLAEVIRGPERETILTVSVHCRRDHFASFAEWAMTRLHEMEMNAETPPDELPLPPYEVSQERSESHLSVNERSAEEFLSQELSAMAEFWRLVTCPYCSNSCAVGISGSFERCARCCRMFGINIQPDGACSAIPLS